MYGLNEKNVSNILYYLKQSKDTDFSCYKAWHAYACTNFEALMLYRSKEESPSSTNPQLDDSGELRVSLDSSLEGTGSSEEDHQVAASKKRVNFV